VAFWAEHYGDLVEGREESLGMTLRFEPTHDLFSSPRVTMGRLDPVVQPLVRSVIGTAAIRAEYHIVTAEFVGHHDARLSPSAHQLAEKPAGGCGISPFLDKDFQHVATIINSPPKPMLLAANGDHHFIKVPFVASRRTAAPDLRDDLRSKPIDPNSDRLVADGNTTRSEQILNIPKAQIESVVAPDRIGDHRSRKAISLQTQRQRQIHHAKSLRHHDDHVHLTKPPGDRSVAISSVGQEQDQNDHPIGDASDVIGHVKCEQHRNQDGEADRAGGDAEVFAASA